MEKLSNVLVPDDVIEQSRIINSTTLKIENLEAQISRMRKDIDLLNITLLANQKRFDENIEQTSKARLQELCSTIRKKLPRELRDEIYRYLVTSPSQPIVMHVENLPMPTEIENVHRTCTMGVPPPRPSQPGHRLFQEEWVGIEAAAELLEAYYANNEFDISVDTTKYKAALEWQWHHISHEWNGMKHPLQKVKKLHIRLRCEDFDRATCVSSDHPERGRGDRATIAFLEKLRIWLMPFCSLIDISAREQTKPEIEISLHTDFSYYCDSLLYQDADLTISERKMWLQEELCFYHMLEAIRGDVMALVQGGVRVRLVHRDRRTRDLTPFLQHIPVEGKMSRDDVISLYIPLWEIEADVDAFEIKLRSRLRERWRMCYATPWGLTDYIDAKDRERWLGVIE